jgi:hypothetical protein
MMERLIYKLLLLVGHLDAMSLVASLIDRF